MTKNAYVHIPFCRRKCNYCSFVSYPKLEVKNDYVATLLQEIKARYQKEKLNTLYIGGGTPSLLEAEQVGEIVSSFNFEPDAEITIEGNPEHLSLEWLSKIKETGINRLSLGAQAFDDKILKIIERYHSVKDVFSAVKNARAAGFKNINLDLIYGLPTQEMSDFSASLITACEIGVEHISSYGLKIEEGSAFFERMPEKLPNEDSQADMYKKLCEITEKYGFYHYEVSNFAKQGFESKHNLNYWKANTYYGFGCAACGYENDTRYSHEKAIDGYLKNPTLLTEKVVLSEKDKLEEKIFLGLRKSDGINVKEINEQFGIDFEQKYGKILQKYEKYFVKKSDSYSFSNDGFLISNYILSDFIDEC